VIRVPFFWRNEPAGGRFRVFLDARRMIRNLRRPTQFTFARSIYTQVKLIAGGQIVAIIYCKLKTLNK
jgi:hypothetical protein